MTQPTLFKPPARTGAMTPRQQLAHDLLAQHPDGLTATTIGQAIHQRNRCRYCHEIPCRYAQETGKTTLGQLRRRGLVVRRRTGRWQLRDQPVTGSQTDTFPEGF